MALGLMTILVLAIIAFSFFVIFAILFNKGALLDKMPVIIGIVIYALILTYIAFTSQPTNFVAIKTISLILGLLSPAALALKLSKNAPIYKVLFLTSIIGNTIVLIF